MDATAPPSLALAKGKRRVSRPVADDHVPAVLAASAEGSTPVAVVAAAPAQDSMAPATPVPVAPPVAAPADCHEDLMDTTQTTATVDAAAQGHAAFADLNTRAKGAMEKGQQMLEEMNSFTKGNVEAMVESSKIAAKGIETLGQEAADFTRRQVEGATQAAKTLAATKSPTEFMKLQSDYARSMFDTMVAETSRSTERMIKLVSDIAQPISNRVAIAAEKVKIAA